MKQATKWMILMINLHDFILLNRQETNEHI
jgi:hypothetical protein